jgi:hypothetical protein
VVNWYYDDQIHVWTRTVGEWQATVLRVVMSMTWYGLVERIGAHQERHQSPDFEWAHDARAWCDTEIARLIRQA